MKKLNPINNSPKSVASSLDIKASSKTGMKLNPKVIGESFLIIELQIDYIELLFL